MDRFSVKARARLNLPQLEEALSLLLDLYRDMRYSLSPRFELETAVSKLCWLDRWISPLELRDAVDSARAVLGISGPPNALKPPAETAAFTEPVRSAGQSSPLSEASPMESAFMDRPGAFTEGFKKVLAQKSELRQPEETIPEAAEVVRRVFRGTVVKQEQAGGTPRIALSDGEERTAMSEDSPPAGLSSLNAAGGAL
jgi:DNA polymerase-3 subunit gamma/tau